MKGKKHSPEQIIKKLREADGMIAAGKTIGQTCQSLEVSEQTLHRWWNQYGGMKSEEAKQPKRCQLESGPFLLRWRLRGFEPRSDCRLRALRRCGEDQISEERAPEIPALFPARGKLGGN